jgi:hypothetical protein
MLAALILHFAPVDNILFELWDKLADLLNTIPELGIDSLWSVICIAPVVLIVLMLLAIFK